MKLIQLAVTAALVTSLSALQAQTVPNPPQKPQSNSLPPPNKPAGGAPVAPKATSASELASGISNPLYGKKASDHLTAGKGVSSGDAIVGERGERATKPTTAAPASPFGAIDRSNPVYVPPPEPNAAEQSYSRNQGFMSQHGTRPDPRVSTMPSQKK